MKRRSFVKKSALAASIAFLLNNHKAVAQSKAVNFKIPADFSLTILATNWGFKGNYDEFCAKAKESGYDGIEVWLPSEDKNRKSLMAAVEKYDLAYGFLAAGNGDQFEGHFTTFKQAVEAATSFKPLFVNCHSGKDYFSFEENRRLIDFTVNHAAQSGVPVLHETHRARILFSAMLTRKFIETIPGLRLTLDISHWTNVHASLLENQKETVDLALTRTDHVHSRVGHSNGPQIGDPRAPEWQKEMEAHFAWWDTIVKTKASENSPLTMTTEFGPPNYMPALPFTRQPITDLWEINSHMKDLWRERYKPNE